MHVCLVHRDLHEVTRGGIGTLYRALAERLIDRGHRVTLVTQATSQPLRLDGAEIVTLDRTEDLEVHRRAVFAALVDTAPDVVDCSTWEAEALHYARRDLDTRAPVVVRGDLTATTMQSAHLVPSERELVHRADRLIAVSEFAAQDLSEAYEVPLPEVVANGVDRNLFHPRPAHHPRSGYKVTIDSRGHVVNRTPLVDLLEAGADVAPWSSGADGRPDVVWVGKITAMKGWDRLERIVDRVHHDARVTILLGHSPAYCPVSLTGTDDVTILQDLDADDLPGFYRAADWLLSTSRWEGFGLAIAEALACGTPALVPADLGTAPELLAAGGGITYHDDAHLSELLTTSPTVSGALPERFDWDANAEASLRIYTDLTAGRR